MLADEGSMQTAICKMQTANCTIQKFSGTPDDTGFFDSLNSPG